MNKLEWKYQCTNPKCRNKPAYLKPQKRCLLCKEDSVKEKIGSLTTEGVINND